VEAFALIHAPQLGLRQVAGIVRCGLAGRVVDGDGLAPAGLATLQGDAEPAPEPGDDSSVVGSGTSQRGTFRLAGWADIGGAVAGQHGLLDPALRSVDVANLPPDLELLQNLDGHARDAVNPANVVFRAGPDPDIDRSRACRDKTRQRKTARIVGLRERLEPGRHQQRKRDDRAQDTEFHGRTAMAWKGVAFALSLV